MDVELLGVTLEGPAPVGRVHLKLSGGLSVLYGLNGSGKTTILEGVRSALSGMQGRGFAALHVRFPRVREALSEEDDYGSQTWRMAEHLRHTYLQFSADQDAPFDIERIAVNDGLARLVKAVLQESFTLAPDLIAGDLIDEVSDKGFFSLIPVGRSSPEWRVWITCPADEETPLLRDSVVLAVRRDEWLKDMDSKWKSGLVSGEVAYELAREQAENWVRSYPDTNWEKAEDKWLWNVVDPGWVPVPMQSCGSYDPRISFLVDPDSSPEADLQDMTIRLSGSHEKLVVRDDEIKVSDDVRTFLIDLSTQAQALLDRLLENPPVLECAVREPDSWFYQDAIIWQALDTPSGEMVPISQLSDVQRRWANFVILIVLLGPASGEPGDWDSGFRGEDRVLILDEPERGLHVRAQRHLANGLLRLGKEDAWTMSCSHTFARVFRSTKGCTPACNSRERQRRGRRDECGDTKQA